MYVQLQFSCGWQTTKPLTGVGTCFRWEVAGTISHWEQSMVIPEVRKCHCRRYHRDYHHDYHHELYHVSVAVFVDSFCLPSLSIPWTEGPTFGFSEKKHRGWWEWGSTGGSMSPDVWPGNDAGAGLSRNFIAVKDQCWLCLQMGHTSKSQFS